MRLVTCVLAGAACAVLSASIAEAANAPLCLAIAANYNKCMRQHQRGGPGGPYEGYGPGYGQGYGGYPDDDDGDGDGGFDGYGGFEGGYRRRRYERAKGACAIWIVQMQASGCFD